MVSLKCSDMGGKCDEVITGADANELVENGMTHVKTAHPEMVADIEGMTDEQKAGWKKTFVDDKLAAQDASMTEEEAPEKEIEVI